MRDLSRQKQPSNDDMPYMTVKSGYQIGFLYHEYSCGEQWFPNTVEIFCFFTL